MKIAALLLAALCGGAAAQEMTLIGSTPDSTFHLIEAEARGNVVRAWVLSEYHAPVDGARSAKMLFEINCGESMARLTAYVYSGARGTGAVVGTSSPRGWEPTMPGTIVRRVEQRVCR